MSVKKYLIGFSILIFTVYVDFLPAQNLQLTNFTPKQYARVDTSLSDISLTFNTTIDTNDLKSKIWILSSYSAMIDYNYKTENGNRQILIFTEKRLKEGERINVIITRQLQGQGGEPFSGFQWEFIVKPSKQTVPYFTPPTIYQQFGGFKIISGDINDDGFIDLILDSGQLLKNDGDGNFSLMQQLPASGDMAPQLMDIDYDGNKEISINPGIYEQREDGFFYLDTTLKVTNIDMNNDGYLDRIKFGIIPPGDTINFIGISYSEGIGGEFSIIDTIVIDKNIKGVINASDFNNDGNRDIAYVTNSFATPYGSGGENKLTVLYRDISGNISNSFIIHNYQFPGGGLGGLFELRADDFNNDNFQDILLITNAEDLIVFTTRLVVF